MSYSCNDNQNYFVKAGKTTSRVLAPPGGKCSISLGWDDEPEEKPTRRQKPASDINHVGQPAKKLDETQNEEEEVMKDDKVDQLNDDKVEESVEKSAREKKDDVPISNNVFAASGGSNVITGRSSSRVLAPPGGKSSIVLG